eukprot:GHVR01167415.1.p1 GENE.GHVR01167415.1~~GHVR01167415.1.p1  ORF type:complete len:401 (-),score=132.19 GHVR01167415.1:252-1454(-)
MRLLTEVSTTKKGGAHLKNKPQRNELKAEAKLKVKQPEELTDKEKIDGYPPKDSPNDTTGHHSDTPLCDEEENQQKQQQQKYDVCVSIFDGIRHESMEDNITYMGVHYSFYLHDREYLSDIQGLIKYLGEKVWEGCMCITCNKQFESKNACISHMKAKGHTHIGTDTEELEAELEEYYDYSSSYDLYMHTHAQTHKSTKPHTSRKIKGSRVDNKRGVLHNDGGSEGGNEGGDWENITDSECSDDTHTHNDDNVDEYDSNKFLTSLRKKLAKVGLTTASLTPTGDLVLPDGRIVCNRDVAYVYKQRLRTHTESPAVRAALMDAYTHTHKYTSKQLCFTNIHKNTQTLSLSHKALMARRIQIGCVCKSQVHEIKHTQHKNLRVGVQTNKLIGKYFRRRDICW